MKDGRLNKCIDCVKQSVKKRYDLLMQEDSFKDKEKRRNRDKYRRLYTGIKPDADVKKKIIAAYNAKYPEKYYARLKSASLNPPQNGMHKHHWSYLPENVKDVIWLQPKDHLKAHRFLVYDQERLMYRSCFDNVLLDTKEKHLAFIENCLATQQD